MSAPTVKLVALRLPSVRSTRAPLLRVIAPAIRSVGNVELVNVFVALSVASFATVRALDAIEPVKTPPETDELTFNVPAETVVVPE